MQAHTHTQILYNSFFDKVNAKKRKDYVHILVIFLYIIRINSIISNIYEKETFIGQNIVSIFIKTENKRNKLPEIFDIFIFS